MRKIVAAELIGQRFGSWTVLHRVPRRNASEGRVWLCRCDCGTELEISTSRLQAGKTNGCQNCAGLRRSEQHKGRKYGCWTVVELRPTPPGRRGPYWLARCDCGAEAIRPVSYLSKQLNCRKCGFRGRYTDKFGYVHVLAKGHPNADKQGYVREHALVMSAHLGRGLYREETVHHLNGVKTDNRLENLELWCSNHCSGQRVADLVQHAVAVLERYAPDKLKKLQKYKTERKLRDVRKCRKED